MKEKPPGMVFDLLSIGMIDFTHQNVALNEIIRISNFASMKIRAIRETGGWFELKALFDGLIISYYSIIRSNHGQANTLVPGWKETRMSLWGTSC